MHLDQKAIEAARKATALQFPGTWLDNMCLTFLRSYLSALTHPAPTHNDGSGEVTEARLLQAVEFVAKWCWRTDPPNANNKLTDGERLSVIKHHPTIAQYGRPHDELAEREAALRGEAS